ncbi:Phage tail protein E [Paracoccus haematequi]|uniref:Phage tail protein E n=1 Tax=Paracoccus haematequi TaxID=2491866 RepID=A0A3S4DX02_9RHOB|nr:phage tail assembly protein [Paracoccus haematequi]VDS09241.1 Phage tail protein E [Paracoccus haematequi]
MSAKISDPITLAEPIQRAGGEAIANVTVRKPDVGTLRGLKLLELLRMDVASHCTLLPRVTTPALLPDEVEALDVSDFTALVTATLSFFMPADELAAIQAAGG